MKQQEWLLPRDDGQEWPFGGEDSQTQLSRLGRQVERGKNANQGEGPAWVKPQSHERACLLQERERSQCAWSRGQEGERGLFGCLYVCLCIPFMIQ